MSLTVEYYLHTKFVTGCNLSRKRWFVLLLRALVVSFLDGESFYSDDLEISEFLILLKLIHTLEYLEILVSVFSDIQGNFTTPLHQKQEILIRFSTDVLELSCHFRR